MTDGPKRTISQELTAVIPREELPPVSRSQVESMGLDPDHPETQDLVARSVDDALVFERDDRDDWRTTPTLVPCPAGCRTCSCCFGNGLVASDVAATWLRNQSDAKNGVVDVDD